MLSIIRWNLLERRWMAFFWALGINAYIALNILVYGSIREQSQALNKALDNLPAGAKALFGGGDFLSPVGYLNSKLYYLMLPLLFTMLAVTLASGLIAREEQKGTLELLLSRPISRARILIAKMVTSIIIVGAVGLSALAVTIACVHSIDYGIPYGRLAIATLACVVLSVLFGAVAWLLLGASQHGKRTAVGAAVFVALGSYLITSLAGYATWLETLSKFLPYHYYNPGNILHGMYDWSNLAGFTCIAVVLLSLAVIGFTHRDLGN
jgi:ABC-2 type transport system permease protein